MPLVNLYNARALPLQNDMNMVAIGPGEELGSPEFWWKMLTSTILVLLGGVLSGLTLGLMGLDELHLRVLAMSSENDKERKDAKRVLKLLNKGRHWVLVVLLLGNVIVNESLPIFLDSAVSAFTHFSVFLSEPCRSVVESPQLLSPQP
jgi:metal transporter CNNM